MVKAKKKQRQAPEVRLTESARTISRYLRDHNRYLNNFPKKHRSACFELLVAKAFSHILHLPLYSSENDDASVSHRIIWQGTINPLSPARGGADAVGHCYDFYLTIETTRNTGANQWSRQFAQSIRHCKEFCSGTGTQPERVITLLICTKLHEDTYTAIKSSRQQYRLIPTELSQLARILETSILALTMRHLELRRLLLNQISECIKTSPSLEEFRTSTDSSITSWQKEVLNLEKNAVFGVKSYEAMRKINRTHVGTSEILRRLQRHPTIKKYLKMIGSKLSVDIIEEGLIQQSLACQLSPTYEGEKLFSPVPFIDFKERGSRLIKAVEAIDG